MITKNTVTIIGIFLFIACNQHAEKKPIVAAPVKIVKKDFSNVQFALNLDLGCYMPLSAGVEDTAIVDGKVYGFCSKECKAEFEKDPIANIKAGEARVKAKK